MDEKKEYTFKVPAEIFYTNEGTLSISIKILANDSSVLKRILAGKTIDDNKSCFGMYVRNDINTLWQTFIMFSGMFTFTETPQRTKEEITAEALELAVLRILDKDDDLCSVCARRETCTKESDEQGEAFKQPGCNVCVDNVIKYFWGKAKNE